MALLEEHEALAIFESMTLSPFRAWGYSLPPFITLDMMLKRHPCQWSTHRVGVTTVWEVLRQHRRGVKALDQYLATKFLHSPVDPQNCSREPSYGQKMEPAALRAYQNQTGLQPKVMGTAVNPLYPILCAQPDGVVFKNGRLDRILEIKAPLVLRDHGFHQVTSNLNIFNRDSSGRLIPSVRVKSQLQLSMAVTGAQKADLLVYSEHTQSVTIISITRDDEYIHRQLRAFDQVYHQHILNK
jgi:YqaJ-like viral recombinase domain